MPAKAKKQSKSISKKKKTSIKGKSAKSQSKNAKSRSKKTKASTSRKQSSRQDNYRNESEYNQGNQFLNGDIRSSRGGRGGMSDRYAGGQNMNYRDNDLSYGSG